MSLRFDVHETEDCPTQAMDLGDDDDDGALLVVQGVSPREKAAAASRKEHETHSKHHGKRLVDRPYCDSCEGSSFCRLLHYVLAWKPTRYAIIP